MLQTCVAVDLVKQRPEHDMFERHTMVKEEVVDENPTRGLCWLFCRLSS